MLLVSRQAAPRQSQRSAPWPNGSVNDNAVLAPGVNSSCRSPCQGARSQANQRLPTIHCCHTSGCASEEPPRAPSFKGTPSLYYLCGHTAKTSCLGSQGLGKNPQSYCSCRSWWRQLAYCHSQWFTKAAVVAHRFGFSIDGGWRTNTLRSQATVTREEGKWRGRSTKRLKICLQALGAPVQTLPVLNEPNLKSRISALIPSKISS